MTRVEVRMRWDWNGHPNSLVFFSPKRDDVMLLRLSNVICGLMITMGLVLQPSSASGGFVTINAGYDLLVTTEAVFNFGGGIPFVGVPLGTYDFGGGSKDVGVTDTILRRLDPVTNLADGDSQTINLQMVALSLRSKFEINWSGFGGNASEYVKTVNLVDGGSRMTIKNGVDDLDVLDEKGTFNSDLRFSFQLEGVTSGRLSDTFTITMEQRGSTWQHIPMNEYGLIDGVNYNTGGANRANDFHTGEAKHGPEHSHTTYGTSNVPEPTSMFAIGLACMAAGGRFARRRRLQQGT
jgi:PEP-CTERM motif